MSVWESMGPWRVDIMGIHLARCLVFKRKMRLAEVTVKITIHSYFHNEFNTNPPSSSCEMGSKPDPLWDLLT